MNKDKNYDIKTGKWGPYNKDYLGISYVADEKLGATFNFELFPGFYKRTLICDRASQDSGVKFFGANKDLTNFTYRYEIEWKDKVYCDATYSIKKDKEVFLECKFVNNTDIVQNLSLNSVFSLNYPLKKWWAFVDGFRKICECKINSQLKYIDAVDYLDIKCLKDYSVDGYFLGETLTDFSTGRGTAISSNYFGGNKEHYLIYKFEGIKANSIAIRYACDKNATLSFEINGKSYIKEVKNSKKFVCDYICIEPQTISEFKVSSSTPITIDCFIVGIDANTAKFRPKKYDVEPKITQDLVCQQGVFGSKFLGSVEDLKKKNNRIFIKYKGIKDAFCIEWDTPHRRIGSFYTDDIAILLNQHIHTEYHTIEESRKTERAYKDIIFAPIFLEPNSTKTINFVLRSGSLKSLKKKKCKPFKNENYQVKYNSDGKKYALSQNLMSYTTLLNIIYPIYERGNFVKAYTPGRLFDCLYTWDNGFIGIGLSTIDFDRAYECLNAYLTPVNDKHSPFIFAGTIMPTQILLYAYLFNNFDRYEDLDKLYPNILSYYRFFSNLRYGKGQMKSGLLKLWHVNYNSGGWDDYPPQLALTSWAYDNKILDGASTENTTPVVITAMTVLISKILKNIAIKLGHNEDVKEFDENIRFYSDAIQKYAYDEESGYYQYVVHDENGYPKTFFKNFDGTLFNSGFDGVYPYISGITNEKQSSKIIKNIKEKLMTKYGLSTVDTTATYYSKSGYWNGCIWFPHQWILWNTLLDNGETELATTIANTALEVWKNETDETYNCLENFSCTTGRGNGYHQFSGLSTPVLAWFKSYYTPNTITVGFLTTVFNKTFSDSEITFDYITESDKATALICLNEKHQYKFFINGIESSATKCSNGGYYLRLLGLKGSVKIQKIL